MAKVLRVVAVIAGAAALAFDGDGQQPADSFRPRWLIGLGCNPRIELGELIGLQANNDLLTLSSRGRAAPFPC